MRQMTSTSTQHRGWRRIAFAPLAIAGVALAVQAVYLADGGKDPTFNLPIVDAATYHTAASRFASGGPLSADAFWQPPLFPLALGCIYRVAGQSIPVAKIVLGFIGALSCVIVWSLASRVFTSRVGVIAALILALYRPFVFFNTQLLPTSLAIFLDLLALTLWIRCMDQSRWYRWLLFGLVVGTATITVPNSAVLLVLAVIWSIAAAVRQSRWKPALAACVLATTGTALPIGAVTWHNYVASHEWVLISTNGGINFYIGNNPRADETIAIRPGEYWRRLARESLSDDVQTRADQSRFFFKKALSYAADQPVDFLRGLGRKALQLINAREIPRNVDPYAYREFSGLLSVLMWRLGPFGFPFGLLAPLAVVGVVVSVAESRETLKARLALIGFILAYGASVVLFFVSSRHRLPIMPAVVIFSAAGLVWLWEQMGRQRGTLGQRGLHPKRRRVAYAAATAFVVTAVVVNLPVAAPTDHVDFEAELRLCVGDAYARQGRLDIAEQYLRDALLIAPNSANAHNKLAHVLARRGEFAEAEHLLDRALALDADSSEARRLLGDLLRRRGQTEEAATLFNEALALDPFSPEAHAGLADLLTETAVAPHAVGRLDEAIVHYREAVRLADEPGWILIRLADALVKQGAYKEAIERYRQALWQIEPDAATLNRIAWLLATCPQVELRDCKQAIEIAEHLCKITEYEHAVALDTLAAAYAECGRTEDAIRWVERAIHLATAAGDTEAAESFRTRLEIYKTTQ